MAQILLVLFLAALLEQRTWRGMELTRRTERELDNLAAAELIITEIYASVAAFAVAEGAALYSVATDTRTTFLVTTPCIAMLFMVGGMLEPMAAITRWTAGLDRSG